MNTAISATIYFWHFYPKMIKWKIQERDCIENDALLQATINVSIIVDLTTYLEALVNKILSSILKQKINTDEKFQNQLYSYLQEKLNDATWSNYSEYFELICNLKLTEKLDSNLVKTINTLFIFRNIIVHGNDIKIDYFYNKNNILDYSSSKKKSKTVIQFLKEKRLINLNLTTLTDIFDIVNNQVITYFYDNTMKYIESIFELLPNKEIEEIKRIYDSNIEY